MKILAIETSCDETAIAILECQGGLEKPHFKEISSKVLSQIEIHKEYGGVFPALAKREHSKNLVPVLLEVLKEAEISQPKTENLQLTTEQEKKLEKILEREPELLEKFLEFIPKMKKPKIDAIAVTQGPGLEPALWVGINFAKALSLVWDTPLVPVNHMEGHIASVLLGEEREVNFPAVSLLISGGHTEFILIKEWCDYEVIGETLDDAVGEAFDKVARMIGLPYPGGPQIAKLAQSVRVKEKSMEPDLDEYRLSTEEFKLPRPMMHSKDLNFSFSGLKTAVLYKIKGIPEKTDEIKQLIAKEFEDAVTEVLVHKTRKALEINDVKSLILGGGVTANSYIKKSIENLSKDFSGLEIFIASPKLSTDNASMIAMAAYINVLKNPEIINRDNKEIKARGNMRL